MSQAIVPHARPPVAAAGVGPSLRPLVVLIGGKSPVRRPGGLETYVRAHALAAAAAGFDVHVFCVAARSSARPTDFGLLHRVATPFRPFGSYMATMHGPFMWRAVVNYVLGSGTGGPLILHSFDAWSVVGAAVSRTLRRSGIEAVPVAGAYTTLVHEHRAIVDRVRREHGLYNVVRFWTRYLLVRSLASRFEHLGYARSRLVLVNYESVRALLRESWGPELEIRQIPYASELAFRGTTPRAPVPDEVARLEPAGAPLILSVSRHDPRKGVDVLLRALAGLADSGVPFRACLLGLGPIIDANRSLLARLGLERQVLITGAVADVGPYLAHADVFVLPSLEEGSGSLSLLEALQSGLPIVASRCDGIPEDVRVAAGPGAPTPASTDEDAAVLVEPGNEQALQDALARVLSDASLRSRLGSRARSIYEQRFSAQGFAAALHDTYADLGVRVA